MLPVSLKLNLWSKNVLQPAMPLNNANTAMLTQCQWTRMLEMNVQPSAMPQAMSGCSSAWPKNGWLYIEPASLCRSPDQIKSICSNNYCIGCPHYIVVLLCTSSRPMRVPTRGANWKGVFFACKARSSLGWNRAPGFFDWKGSVGPRETSRWSRVSKWLKSSKELTSMGPLHKDVHFHPWVLAVLAVLAHNCPVSNRTLFWLQGVFSALNPVVCFSAGVFYQCSGQCIGETNKEKESTIFTLLEVCRWQETCMFSTDDSFSRKSISCIS